MSPDHCIVYILTNEAMPDYVKIGTTELSIKGRMKQLYNTSIPIPFECHYAAVVPKTLDVEKRLHRAFDRYRVNKNREFFEIEPDAVAEIIRMVAIKEVTPSEDVVETKEDRTAMHKLEERRKNFSFNLVGIPIGSILTFKHNPEVTCEVTGNRQVLFEGQQTSLSAAALIAMRSVGFDWKSAQGSLYWLYEDKILQDIRDDLENE